MREDRYLSSGWSARGGQSTIAYLPNGNPAGSSSDSAIAASIGLATVTLGIETSGSITIPASFNNIVGIKVRQRLVLFVSYLFIIFGQPWV